MASEEIEEALEFKRGLERDFEAAAGLDGRSYHSAAYSLPQVSPVMWINLNPGGTPDDHRVLSDEQMARGQHEFWHGDGKTSRATGSFLAQIFPVPSIRLRSIQGTNVAWERSRAGRDIDLDAAARRAAPFLRRYVDYARPRFLVFGGSAAFDLFVDVHAVETVKTHEVIMGNWGRTQARIFVAATLAVPGLGEFEALVVSHPSRGIRAGVLERCQERLAGIELPEALA